MVLQGRNSKFKMKVPIWAYVVYGIVKLLNCVDWIILAVFGKRLQRIDMDKFVSSLSIEQQHELENQDILEPLSLQMEGLKNEVYLNAFRRYMFIRQMKNSLQLRVEHKAALIRNPDILKTPIRRPVFLIGLPRTGTTLLLHLLSVDPGFRAPMLWELMEPLPPKGPVVDWQHDSRYIETQKGIELWKFIADIDVDSRHYTRAHLPEECWFLMQHSFYVNPTIQTLFSMNKFNEWCVSRDLGFKNRLYTFYKQQLQILGYGHGMERRHFLLKWYIHLLNLEAIDNIFPDACLVFTYRKLRDVVPSLISLLFDGFSRSVDPDHVRRVFDRFSEVANIAAGNLQTLLQEEKSRKNLLFLDYEDLIKDTAGTAMKIYNHFGLDMQDDVMKMFQEYLRNNPKHKHGKHRYSLNDCGITLNDIRNSCGQYITFMEQFTDEVV